MSSSTLSTLRRDDVCVYKCGHEHMCELNLKISIECQNSVSGKWSLKLISKEDFVYESFFKKQITKSFLKTGPHIAQAGPKHRP